MKYTVIWEDRWRTGSLHHCMAKKSFVEADSIEDVMKEYGEHARWIFEGHLLSIGEEFDQSMVDVIVSDNLSIEEENVVSCLEKTAGLHLGGIRDFLERYPVKN